jgi:hypothetical protein
MILKKHKNTLLTIIQESGLDPTRFSAEDGTIDREKFLIIQLRNSPLRFAVRPSDTFDTFLYRCSNFLPGLPLGNRLYSHNPQNLYVTFKEWLNSVVTPYLDEASTPDFWRLMKDTYSDTIREQQTPDYFEPFSEEEKNQLRLSIGEFRLSIVNNFNPHKEELDAINNRLKHLSDALDKHNKFDWKGIAIHTVISIAITLALNPEQTNHLFQLFKSVFSHIIYLLP